MSKAPIRIGQRMRQLAVGSVAWLLLVAVLPPGIALGQGESASDEATESLQEPASYGDQELIAALRQYDLLDEWIMASPVSPAASLVLVTGTATYQAQRQRFLDALEAWAASTELVRADLARIDNAQANSDRLRSIITQVRDALVLDDRLATESKTLLEIEDALEQLERLDIAAPPTGVSEDPLDLAEGQLTDLRQRIEPELVALNGYAPAITDSGIDAFVGFEDLSIGLNEVNARLTRSRDLIRPARESSERLVSSALAQIPSLHASRMLGASAVDGLSIVTLDAYIRAANRAGCSVDWALLAGIGAIESNHGRLGGASVSSSGQVSTTILGPVLDGGETARERARSEERSASIATFEAARRAAESASAGSVWVLLRDRVEIYETFGAGGNGFAVVVDTDDGRLDGNDQWDRAVGPMQFIPETWSQWSTDGNGDGRSDPHNLYDAAASAARFLCDLSAKRGPSPSRFVLGYNDSTSYVRRVLSTASTLRSASLPVP